MSGLQGRERSTAINLTLAAASEIGLKKSLKQHGANLSGTDKNAIELLTKKEIFALNEISKKLPGMGIGEVAWFDDNTNNNNKAK